MQNFLKQRVDAYGGIGLGIALMALAFIPEMPRFGGIFVVVIGGALALVSAVISWRQRRRSEPPAVSPTTQSESGHVMFEFENSDVEMEDTLTEGSRSAVRSKGGRFKSKRWTHRHKPPGDS